MVLRLSCLCPLLLSCWFSTARAEAPRIEIVESVPTLSLESIYQPQNRFKYIQSPTPISRWVQGDDGQATLLIKRDDGWKQIDPRDGNEVVYQYTETLISNVESLGEIDHKRATQIVQSWISIPEQTLVSGLVRIDDSIAILGTSVKPRWITRAAKAWKEVSLSPDATQVAYVEANDLYVMQLESGRVSRLTLDGSATKLNGVLDWVYQEEIYGRGNYRGYWWRDDSTAIAFLRLDTSEVAAFTLTGSSQPRGETFVERYPKAGDPIPKAELWCATLPADKAATNVSPVLSDLTEAGLLVTRIGWEKRSGKLLVQTSNRIQNDVSLYKIEIQDASKRQLMLHEQCDKWLEVQELPHVLKTGEYLRLSDLPSGRRRLWRISSDGTTRLPTTPDDFDVREILFVDPDDHFVLVNGDRLRGTVGQQLYKVDLQTPAALKRVTEEAPWHVVTVSADGKWMVDLASSLTSPTSMWLRSLVEPAGESPRLVNQERVQLHDVPIEITWPSIKTEDGVNLPAYVIRPKTSAPVPVLIEIYGGPLTPTVRDGWQGSRYLFHQMLAREGIGVMVVDNRSSGGRGLADCWTIHRRMGEVESQDLVAAANWLGKQSWVEAKKLGIRGWSFGGFLTLHAMTHSDKFAAGVAGGSVTDWRNYDAIYTERYMGLPSDNVAGYDSTSPKVAADKLHGRVLLLHGELDDNVHLGNALQMAAAMQKAGQPFDLMIYPGSAHAVHDPAQNYHLMQTTVDFLRREFKLPAAER